MSGGSPISTSGCRSCTRLPDSKRSGATERTSLPSPPRLEDGTLLLEYAFTSEIGVAFVLSPRGLSVVLLDLGTRKLRQLLTRWQLNVESAAHALRADRPLEPLRANALGHLSGLYQALIAPVAAHLEGVERLIVVPFGPAHGVPFHALFDGARHLIERTDVWTSPSSSLFELCAQRVAPTTSEALVMGYSGGRLPFILDEARSVSAAAGWQLLSRGTGDVREWSWPRPRTAASCIWRRTARRGLTILPLPT